jgi:hypothetical protein
MSRGRAAMLKMPAVAALPILLHGPRAGVELQVEGAGVKVIATPFMQ